MARASGVNKAQWIETWENPSGVRSIQDLSQRPRAAVPQRRPDGRDPWVTMSGRRKAG